MPRRPEYKQFCQEEEEDRGKEREDNVAVLRAYS